MKTTRPLLALLFALPLALSAQEDTLRVQTLTFDSITTQRRPVHRLSFSRRLRSTASSMASCNSTWESSSL